MECASDVAVERPRAVGRSGKKTATVAGPPAECESAFFGVVKRTSTHRRRCSLYRCPDSPDCIGHMLYGDGFCGALFGVSCHKPFFKKMVVPHWV